MIRKIKNFYHLIQGVLAVIFLSFPKGRIKIIGVTGTDGKTTTTFLIFNILKAAGKKVGMISTVYAKVGKQEFDTGLHTTTPSVFQVYKLIRKSILAGDEYLVLETTSHALDQERVFRIPFYIGVITNITHEHLDYHKTYENYVAAKAKLLLRAKIAIVNKDDRSFFSLKRILKENKKDFLTYSVKENSDYQKDLSTKMSHPIPEYNKYNYLAAYAVADQLGIDKKKIIAALDAFKNPPGRMDTLYDKDFRVILDFAHTPNAISQALASVRTSTKGRLIHVFGSAGKRDQSKRPLMGEASGDYADVIIITEEDYRTEDPTQIADMIAEGVKKHGFTFQENISKDSKKAYTYILDRKKAIETALDIAQPGDCIICTGKGHEQSLARGHKEYPWNEREELKKLLQKRG
jgi:UDP-N-acetylmuramoyl-L-alanyl-D-glutamate--2,6-diaminopimelate ligase